MIPLGEFTHAARLLTSWRSLMHLKSCYRNTGFTEINGRTECSKKIDIVDSERGFVQTRSTFWIEMQKHMKLNVNNSTLKRMVAAASKTLEYTYYTETYHIIEDNNIHTVKLRHP
jgi:hypothetical protein